MTAYTDNDIISYSYDFNNRITEENHSGKYIRYSYDDAERVTAVLTNYGETRYQYDALDRVTRVIAHDGSATVYEYDANGNRTVARYSNGAEMTYEYDLLNRLTREVIKDGNGTIISQYDYTLGKAGERLFANETYSPLGDNASTAANYPREIRYTYDKLYRLTQEKLTKAAGKTNSSTTTTTYAYDSASNRISKIADGVETIYTYNALNQLIGENTEDLGKSVAYAYDKNGNLISQNDGASSLSYTFNGQNQLVRATGNSGQNVFVEEYGYDALGNRISKINENDGTNGIYYLVSTNGSLSQVLAEVTHSGTSQTLYTRSDG
ncbi:hypothetical protein AGMMS49975_21920 [Clostridia bacterium]|nr:hypothetical protein AGMMS49975_21920 [Clostridia bacterium]